LTQQLLRFDLPAFGPHPFENRQRIFQIAPASSTSPKNTNFNIPATFAKRLRII
jgi:hypothetical protein